MLHSTLSVLLLAVAASSASAQSVESPTATGVAAVTGDPSSTCAYVSNNEGAAPVSQDIFDADITQVDGKSTPLAPENRYRVKPGARVLTVSDLIEPSKLPAAAMSQIAKMKRHEEQRAYKKLEIDVQPGVIYLVGAKLLRDKLDAESIRNNEYWEPVVWDQRAQRCP